MVCEAALQDCRLSLSSTLPRGEAGAQVPRPAYIPPELHGSAQYVEISYEGMGTARVWRIPRDSLGDIPESDLDEPG